MKIETVFLLILAMAFTSCKKEVTNECLEASPLRSVPASEMAQISEDYASVLVANDDKALELFQRAEREIRENYRLVGTSVSDNLQDSLAFVADKNGKTIIWRISSVIPNYDLSVAEISTDYVTISKGIHSFSLTQSSNEPLNKSFSKPKSQNSANQTAYAMQRFGVTSRSDSERVVSRTALLDYFNELTASPNRLISVFDSLAPRRNSDGKITGYILDIQGEPDFFAASGLLEGDVVTKANEIPMENRYIAEGLIRRFVNGTEYPDGVPAGAVDLGPLDLLTLEVERNGKPIKLVYHLE